MKEVSTSACYLKRLMTTMNYRLVDVPFDETAARLVDIGAWPRRSSVRSMVKYCEWFDWSELFIRSAPVSVLRICKDFGTPLARIACLATDDQSERMTSLRVIEIEQEHLSSSYSEAIWDDRSTSFGRLGAMARIVLLWDSRGRWLVVNDRFYEIGTFVVLDDALVPPSSSFFRELDEEDLLCKFSSILRADTNVAATEVERWKPAKTTATKT